MLTSDFIQSIAALIREFGFPIFVALCGLVLFWRTFDYMKTTVNKKDCDFLEYIKSSNQQMDAIVREHNESFRQNSQAIGRLSDTIQLRYNNDRRREKIMRGEIGDEETDKIYEVTIA